ncbi:MAG: DNA ligase, partial [Gammaproteobacteria bacterium]|nr:DNA ligase [Gammaproteobacteria bacterium]
PNQAGGLLQRMAVLERYLQVFPAPYLRIIQQTEVSGHEQVARRLSEVVAQGGEGLVVRDPAAPYYAGRSPQALKVKQKQDAECIVRDYTPGAGKYHGHVGALLCELVAGAFPALKAGQRIIRIGSGLSDQQRQTPPPKGTTVTFQYMGTTQSGLPRFPVFLRVRADEGL